MSVEQREGHRGHQSAASFLQGPGEQLTVIPGVLSALGRHVLIVPGHHACPGHRPAAAPAPGAAGTQVGASALTYEDAGPFCFGDVGISTAFFLVASCVPENVAF